MWQKQIFSKKLVKNDYNKIISRIQDDLRFSALILRAYTDNESNIILEKTQK